MSNTKYSRYQDYVIRDGKLIGEFEEMYKDFEDPWEQTTRKEYASEKAVVINLIKKSHAKKLIELGCGFGHFTNKINKSVDHILGVDISETAINKAKSLYPNCEFVVGDILDFDIYDKYQPDVIVMAEITWYVLDKLDDFKSYLKNNLPNTQLIHLLTTYPAGTQQYGKEKFTNLEQIMDYFQMSYLEYGEITCSEINGCKRTYFFGKW